MRVQPNPQNFWFGENPGKICGNFGKMCETVRKIAVCPWILQKWHPKSRCRCFLSFTGQVFVLFFSGKLVEIWASSTMVLELCFDLNKHTQHEKKCSRFFGGHFLWSFFRASLGKFGQKSFAPQDFACSTYGEGFSFLEQMISWFSLLMHHYEIF